MLAISIFLVLCFPIFTYAFPTSVGSCLAGISAVQQGAHANLNQVDQGGQGIDTAGFQVLIGGQQVYPDQIFEFTAGEEHSIQLVATGDIMRGFLLRLESVDGQDTRDALASSDPQVTIPFYCTNTEYVGGMGHVGRASKTLIEGTLYMAEPSYEMILDVTTVVSTIYSYGIAEWYFSTFTLRAVQQGSDIIYEAPPATITQSTIDAPCSANAEYCFSDGDCCDGRCIREDTQDLWAKGVCNSSVQPAQDTQSYETSATTDPIPTALYTSLPTPVSTPLPSALVPMTVPVSAPISAPVTMPVPAPISVSVPVPTPVPAPISVSVPVTMPLPAPISVSVPVTMPLPAPISVPVTMPLPAPISAPVTTPAPAPISVPVSASVTTPAPAPISVPVSVPVSVPTPVPVSAPVTTPVSVPTPVPVSPPVTTPEPIPVPVSVPVTTPVPVSVPVTMPVPAPIPVPTPISVPAPTPAPVKRAHTNAPGVIDGAVWTQVPISHTSVTPSVVTSTVTPSPIGTSTNKSATLAPTAKEQMKEGSGGLAIIAAATAPISRAKNIGEWSLWAGMLSMLVVPIMVVF